MKQPIKIYTKSLRLEPLKEQHAQTLFEYRSNPSVYQFQRWKPKNLKDANQFIKKYSSNVLQTNTWNQLGIFLASNTQLIGDCGINIFGEKQVEIGYTIDPKYQQKGFATEATAGLINYLFQYHNIHRISAHTDPLNIASQRVLQKLGFRQEGYFRKSLLIGDKWFDDLVFALLREEWIKIYKNYP